MEISRKGEGEKLQQNLRHIQEQGWIRVKQAFHHILLVARKKVIWLKVAQKSFTFEEDWGICNTRSNYYVTHSFHSSLSSHHLHKNYYQHCLLAISTNKRHYNSKHHLAAVIDIFSCMVFNDRLSLNSKNWLREPISSFVFIVLSFFNSFL